MTSLLIVRMALILLPAVPAGRAAGSASTPSLTVIIEIILGLLPFITGYMSFRWSTRSATEQAQAAQHAVDAQAYERARQIYDYAIRQLRDDNDRLRHDLGQQTTDAAQARGLRAELAERDQAISQLRDHIDLLRRRLGEPGS